MNIFKRDVNKGLHWTTVVTEKLMLAAIGGLTVVAAGQEVYRMYINFQIELADLFLLFIYTEVIGMIGAYYISHRIPVTLPLIIAMTALTRLIILHAKEGDPLILLAEGATILIIAAAAYLISLKDKLSLEKKALRNDE